MLARHALRCNDSDLEYFVEIFTNAPDSLDLPGARQVEQLDCLRVVHLGDDLTAALEQLITYKDKGFFASVHRSDAIGFVHQREMLGRRIDEAIQEHCRDENPGHDGGGTRAE